MFLTKNLNTPLFSEFYIYLFSVCACVHACAHAGFLLLCGLQKWNSARQAPCQEPLSTEPPHAPPKHSLSVVFSVVLTNQRIWKRFEATCGLERAAVVDRVYRVLSLESFTAAVKQGHWWRMHSLLEVWAWPRRAGPGFGMGGSSKYVASKSKREDNK